MSIINHTDKLIRCTEFDLISQLRIAFHAFMIHPLQGRNMDIHIIVDTNFLLSLIISMKSSSILGQCAFPRYGHRKKQGVQPWGVKSLSNILSGGNDHHILIVRHILQCCQLFTLILLLLTTNKQKDILHLIRQTTSEQYSVFFPFRQQNWCTPLLNQLQSI